MLFWQFFSNIIIYVKIVGKIPDQHLNQWLFSNPGDKVQKRWRTMGQICPVLQTNFNICDHIDLASLTLFIQNGYVCLLHFYVYFTQNITKVCFKHYLNLLQDLYLIIQFIKKERTKNNLRQSQFSKKRGGSNEVWSWSQIQWSFFLPLP